MTAETIGDVKIHWTKHAVERAAERFGLDHRIIIPNRIIKRVGAEKEHDEEFRVRRGRVIYVCKKDHDDVVIVTVLDNEMPPNQSL